MIYAKRIVVALLALPTVFYTVFVWMAVSYIRDGKVSRPDPLDRLTKWAEK